MTLPRGAFVLCTALMAAPLAGQEQDGHGWIDPHTKLTWTTSGNGKDVTWKEALSYCQGLSFDEHKDWRLPSIDEIEGVYQSNDIGRLETSTSMWLWSATHSSWGGNWGSAAWLFSLVSNRRLEHGVLTSRNSRAVCVRDPD